MVGVGVGVGVGVKVGGEVGVGGTSVENGVGVKVGNGGVDEGGTVAASGWGALQASRAAKTAADVRTSTLRLFMAYLLRCS
jgi:hypothetical protein